MKIIRILGSARLAVLPSAPLLTLTVRHPMTRCPSEATIFSKWISIARRWLTSGGRKTIPTP